MVGSVALERYPVKSMMGEALNAVEVSEVGLLGDRAYAIRDISDGKIGRAPKKSSESGRICSCFRAAFVDPPAVRRGCSRQSAASPRGRMGPSSPVTRPTSARSYRARSLEVTFAAATVTRPSGSIANAEEYWADIEGLEHRDIVTDFALPERTFSTRPSFMC